MVVAQNAHQDGEREEMELPETASSGGEDLLYKIAITQIPLVGAVTARTLISYCGGVEAVFRARKRELCKIPGIGDVVAKHVVEQDVLAMAERELEFMQTHGIRPYFYLDKEYPARLKPYRDSPVMLYYKGAADLNAHRTVAIVGTRTPSHYGIAACEELVEGLKPYNVTVISGLAFGIDITAHRKCLEAGVPTIAALGHGLDMVYPGQHRHIAARMLKQGGLLSEYPSRTKPDREHFPMRNRIIAGLSDAVIVVESGASGGSIITAKMGNGYNKDVFAVPGKVNDRMSQGCNHLIKTNQAHLLESAADVGYIMRWEETGSSGVQQELFVELNAQEQIIVNLLAGHTELSIDALTFECGINHSEMAALLLGLEFKGLIRPLPGKRYVSAR